MSDRDIDLNDVTLSPPDAAAVDALLDGPLDPSCEKSEEQLQRHTRAKAWLRVVGTAPVPEMPADLAARTLAAVKADCMYLPRAESAGAPEEPAQAVGEAESPSKIWARWRRRAAVIGSMGVAAMLLLAVAIQGFGTIRKSQARMACVSNLRSVALACGNYSSSFGGEMPMLAMPANHNWLYGNVETGARDNDSNLRPLVGSYIALAQLFCAGAGIPDVSALHVGRNELPAISYSYRNLYGAERPRWDRSHGTIMMADRNPVFAALARPGSEEKNSQNHGGQGNNVMRADATVTWEITPDIGPNHDNIWTLGSGKDRQTHYLGTEVPADVNDVFVCP